jgi:hypothetical protein
MENETIKKEISVQMNHTTYVDEFDLYVSNIEAEEEFSVSSVKVKSFCINVGQSGLENIRQNMMVGDVISYKSKDDTQFEIRLMSFEKDKGNIVNILISKLPLHS